MHYLRSVRLALLAASLLLAACGGSTPPPMTSVSESWSQEGVASWYGPGFDGKRTASGEVYDMEDLTAAHKRLPFGTRVQVQNLDNGRRTEVRINDRGPFVDDRIIDLSMAAARDIEMLGPGTARVRISVVEMSAMLSCSMVQAGAFADAANAESVAGSFRERGLPVVLRQGSDGLTRVLLGPYDDLDQAERARDRYDGMVRPCE
ncbi:septal ring lytic transglycosylase RlpA family protein [Gemmatimonadota bacterium]